MKKKERNILSHLEQKTQYIAAVNINLMIFFLINFKSVNINTFIVNKDISVIHILNFG